MKVGGTISGEVKATAGTAPLGGRRVTATNLVTMEVFDSTTSTTGGYTMQVPSGTYRLDVELRQGEVLKHRPDDKHISTGDLDAQENFEITVATMQ